MLSVAGEQLVGLALKGPVLALPGADQFPGGHVGLVTMPYSSLSRPSILHADLWFAESVGLRRYDICAEQALIEKPHR